MLVIGTALTHFNPNLFIVDNVPRGALQELSPVLENLKDSDTTRINALGRVSVNGLSLGKWRTSW